MTYRIVPGGDATEPLGDGLCFIPHVCNDIGAWGAGFVIALSKKWAQPEARYRDWYNGRSIKIDGEEIPFKLGQIQPVKVASSIVVVNMIAQKAINSVAQEGVDGDPLKAAWRPPIRYGSLMNCMRRVKLLCDKYKLASPSLHCPKFGSALAGGQWDVIELMIHEIWIDVGIPVTIYNFDRV